MNTSSTPRNSSYGSVQNKDLFEAQLENALKRDSLDRSASPSSVTGDLETKPWAVLPASQKSLRTTNPIRAIVDPIASKIQSGAARGDGKNMISLALGDPTAAGNLPPCPAALQAIETTLKTTPHAAGYANACGSPAAREAIAKTHSSSIQKVTAEQVVVANGCSGALELVLTAMLDEDSILLVPEPGFPLYQVIAESHGASVAFYKLDPNNGWQVDLDHVQELVAKHGDKVRGIVVNNPSNPTGAVFSRKHLQAITRTCEQLQLPIVADEVYGDLTFFESKPYIPMAEVAAELGNKVPVVTVSGIGKQFLLPGWRVGWAVFHDNQFGSLQGVEAGTKRLAQVILGASHLAQAAVPVLLDPNNTAIATWKAGLRETLFRQATALIDGLQGAPGLEVLTAEGAMYVMIRIDPALMDSSILNELDFSQQLLVEENVFVLPGSCFGTPNVFRGVFCASPEVLEEAAERIQDFCQRHQI